MIFFNVLTCVLCILSSSLDEMSLTFGEQLGDLSLALNDGGRGA